MIMKILAPALMVGALGLIFGILLSVASKFFAVEGDPKVIKIRQSLPGANCGACGYPGCDGFAAAVADGTAQVNGCPVCSEENLNDLAKIMGVEVNSVEPLVAVVRCQGTIDNAMIKYTYEGIEDCAAAAQLADGYKACKYACLGMGNCVKVCPTNAIEIENGLAKIDKDRCITCGKCAAVCPRGIIGLLPTNAPVIIRCRATAKGTIVRDACNVGCIGCGICEKTCQYGAIEMIDDLPVIDYDKCIGCGECANKCPRKCISVDRARQRIAFISEENCIGCTLCKRACKFDAIEGEIKQAHVVNTDKCVGCGECVTACKKNAVHIIARK